MKTKICSKCKKEKNINGFWKDKSRKDNTDHWCKECRKKYRKNNKKRVLWYRKYYLKNQNKIKAYHKIWYQKNKLKVIKQSKFYRLKNKKYYLKYQETYRIRRSLTDMNYRIKRNLRSRISHAIKHNSKSQTTMELIGCSIDQLKQHLQSQFKSEMSWDNYGKNGWEIDHIVPCSSFDLSKPSEQKKCFNYTNLQPLWAEENWNKRDKIYA